MERKQQRWETGQAILHRTFNEREQRERAQKDGAVQSPGRGKGAGQEYEAYYEAANAYGSFRYVKEAAGSLYDGKASGSRQSENADLKQRQSSKGLRKGFTLEAKEAPGTRGHTQKEKHVNPDSAHKVRVDGEHSFYASGTPFRNQAVFYDISEWDRARDLLEAMQYMLKRGHRTLPDTFGFLEQDSERMQKQMLLQDQKERLTQEANREREVEQKTGLEREEEQMQGQEWKMEGEQMFYLEEFEAFHRQMNGLHDRLLKKEAKEQQLCDELQRMIDLEKRKGGQQSAEKEIEKAQKWEPRRPTAILEQTTKAGAEESKPGAGAEAEEPEVEVEEPEAGSEKPKPETKNKTERPKRK